MKVESVYNPLKEASTAKRLSIAAIIPLYNGERYITQSIQSVLDQILPPDEIIVVDDGSSDDGPQVVRDLAKTHPITLLQKENGGQSSARNFGVSHCKCDLIALLDQDDLWYPDHLSELIRPFEEHPAVPPLGWVYSNLDLMDIGGLLMRRSYIEVGEIEHPKRSLYNMLKWNLNILPTASLISKEAFEKVGGFDERLCGYEDDDLFLRIFRVGYDNVFIDRALGSYRFHPGSSSLSSRFLVSRSIYCRKLFETYASDSMLMYGYVNQCLIPRFYTPLLREVRIAVSDPGGWDALDRILGDLDVILPHLPPKTRRKIGLLRSIKKHPHAARAVYKIYRLFRRLARRG